MNALFSLDGGLTLLAPLVAIGFALVTKKVHPSLFAGAVVGALVATDLNPIAAVYTTRVADGVTTHLGLVGYAYNAIFDRDHLLISAFSLLVAATVGVMGASGGTRALVGLVERFAKGPRGAMVSTWMAGAIVFFDDYANCLVVGNAMGPLCDRFKVSRAKLAYIVDSTAAPVASLALVSTWVGYEVGLIEEALIKAGSEASAFSVFVEALPYRFYSIFTIFFVGSVAILGRDFGPMLTAEMQARAGSGPVATSEDDKPASSFWLAALPVMTLVILTFALLVVDGRQKLGADAVGAPLFKVLGEADPYLSMFLGSAAAFSVAAGLSVGMGALASNEIGRAAWGSVLAVFEALGVLYLAWMLGDAIEHAGAADFLAGVLGGWMAPWMLPTTVFLLAAGTAFATGTSFGTMAILIPLAVPLGVTMGGPEPGPILYGATAAVLAGSCLGDHASPISDTTVLSALGSGVDLVTHVRTQLPYALSAGAISVAVGYVPSALGVSPWLLIPAGLVACVAVVRGLGTRV